MMNNILANVYNGPAQISSTQRNANPFDKTHSPTMFMNLSQVQ